MQPRVISKDELLERLALVPEHVREVYASEESFNRVVNFSKELQLPPQIQNILGREVGYAILGLRKPEETKAAFLAVRASKDLADKIIERIARDILVEVEVKKEPAPTSGPEKSPAPIGERVREEGKVATLTPKSLPAPAQEVLLAPVVKNAPVSTNLIKPSPVPVPPTPIQPTRPRTMASDVEAIGPESTVTRPPAEKSAAPGAVPSATKAPPPKPMPAPVPNASNVEADLKKYGVDPYREPVE